MTIEQVRTAIIHDINAIYKGHYGVEPTCYDWDFVNPDDALQILKELNAEIAKS